MAPKKIIDPFAKDRRAPIRVAISIPAGDQCATSFAYDLAKMVGFTASHRPDIEIRLNVAKGSLIPQQRQDLAIEAVEADATHVLFLDSDMRFPKDTLIRLLAHKKPVVGCNYVTRKYPCNPTSMCVVDGKREWLYTEETSTGLVPVEWVATGVLLIETDVFRRMPLPWFNLWYDPQNGFVGEDVWFCMTAREKLGIEILVDQDLSQHIVHLGEWDYKPEHAVALREMLKEEAQERATT